MEKIEIIDLQKENIKLKAENNNLIKNEKSLIEENDRLKKYFKSGRVY